jgi:hypothetical protein
VEQLGACVSGKTSSAPVSGTVRAGEAEPLDWASPSRAPDAAEACCRRRREPRGHPQVERDLESLSCSASGEEFWALRVSGRGLPASPGVVVPPSDACLDASLFFRVKSAPPRKCPTGEVAALANTQ